MAQPDFQSRFPSNNFFRFGLNDQAIESATQKIDQLLTEAGKWVPYEKKQQARASARSRIHVILEVDKNNPYLIKNVEVVQSNWLSWQITKLEKFIQGIRENKTYHFGKGGAIRNLSQYMEALSKEYAKNSSLDDHQILQSEGSFNPTVKKINNFLELITSSEEKSENQKKLKTLYLQHDIAVAHAMVRKGIQSLDSKKPQQGILDILEGRRELLFRGYDLHKYSKDLFESFNQSTMKALEEAQFQQKVLKLALEGNIDLDEIISHCYHSDPLKEQLQNIQILKKMDAYLQILKNPETKRENFIEVGILFIESFHALDEETRNLSEMQQRFDRIDFITTANGYLDDISKEIEKLGTNDANAFAKSYQAYVAIQKQLKTIQEQLETIQKSIKDNELDGIRNKLSEVSSAINKSLHSKRGEFLKNLNTIYKEASDSLDKQIGKLTAEQKDLQEAQKSEKRAEEELQGFINTIITGEPVDVLQLLTPPTRGLEKEDMALVYALRELVKFSRLTQTSSGEIEKKKLNLDELLKGAGLDPLPLSVSALQHLNSPTLQKRVLQLYKNVSEAQDQAEQAFINAQAALLKVQPLSKREEIQQLKQKRDAIIEIEIAALLKELGVKKDGRLVTFDHLQNIVFGKKINSKEIIEQLERRFSEQPEILKNIQNLKEKALSNKFLGLKEREKYRYALADIANNMLERRDAFNKEIKAFEALKFSVFYESKAAALEEVLQQQYCKKYGFPHVEVRESEIDEKITQLTDEKNEEYILLTDEKTRILEMVAAYKERRDLENQLKRAEKKAGEAEAKVIGWNQLFQGLHHFTKVFACYAKADKTSKQVAELTEKMKSGKEEISALRQRQKVIHGKIKRLKTYYEAQVSISSAQAMAGLLERIGEFQTAQI